MAGMVWLGLVMLKLSKADVCVTDCPDGEAFPAMTFTALAATLNVEVRFIPDAGLNALTNLTTESNYDAGAASCPFFRIVAGNIKPREEHSSDGWSFGTPTISNGVASVPMIFACPAYVAGDAHRSSMSVAMAMGAMAMASMSGSAGASVAAACALPGVNGQPSCTEGCQPFAHVELVGGHPNVTIDDSTFICPDGGCNIDSSCSTTAPENKCEAGWVMGRPFSTQDGHVVSKLIQRKASGWAEDLPAETGAVLSSMTKAETWRLAGLAEHSSVAAFGRVALELMAVGAPGRLVADAHQAAIDEVKHASRAFSLARLFGKDQVAPSSFPMEPQMQISTNLSEIAKKTLEEGCMSEMVSLARAKEQLLQGGLIPEEEIALQLVFHDEAQHAALAWRTIHWALQEDGNVGKVLQMALDNLKLRSNIPGPNSETTRLHHEMIRRTTIPWLSSLLQTQSFKGIQDLQDSEESGTVAQAAGATAKTVAALLELHTEFTV